MKNQKSILLFICILFGISSAFAQNGWITDEEMQFKINAPQGYTQNQMRDGTDKVLTLLSSDQNVMVRVRAMQATDQFTPEILQKVFEQNMIQGAQRVLNERGNLNNIPAQTAAYTWAVDGSDAVLGIYYIVQQGFAYIVWSAVPRNLLQQRSAESDGILNTFTLLKPTASSSGSGLLSGLGNAGSSNSSGAGNTPSAPSTSTPPSSPPPPAPLKSGYLEMVSDDACIEHAYPKNYKATSVEQGQSIWEDGSGIKMIIQTIIKSGDFRSYTSSNVASIAQQGADVVKKKYMTVNGLDVFQYSYTYGNTYFAYFAVENNNVYYLVGFVGDKLKQFNIVNYANDVVETVKIAACGQQSGRKLNVVTTSENKTATISHHGFDFSEGKTGADGETISWCPEGSNPKYSQGVWWRSSGKTQYKNMGNVSLSSITSVPSSWDNPAVPLLPGNAYVIKCQDGYAAIKVISVDANSNVWPVEVEYKFTSNNSF